MKTIPQILAFGLLTIFFSCGQPNDKKNIAVLTDTLEKHFYKKEEERLETRREIEERNRIDSVRVDKALSDAFKIATQQISKVKFQKEYEFTPDNDYNVKVEISLDTHFSNDYPHLIIRRHSSSTVYIDVYSKNNGKFKKVVSHEQWNMTYTNDTIRDINGDGLKDFVVNWYGSTGCCLKAFSNIYLLRQDKKEFSKGFEFINPTFSPKERVIRGVCYGHPGETEMYKYKWHGETIDTLEYISFEKNSKGEKTGKIITSKHRPYDNNEKDIKRLNSIPIEYKIIEGYDWFTGEL